MSFDRVRNLLGIEIPIVQGGMVWCSGWRLASAVSNAGGLGLLGAGSMHPQTLAEHIRKCRAATTKPFGVNVPLLYPEMAAIMEILAEEGVKIVFTSAGNPANWTPHLKSKGMIVVHVVSSSRFAQKAEQAGVDAVVAEGFEAGGHNGREETTTLCLVPLVADAVRVPVIAAGGIASGRAILAMEALGASGVQIGSRFAVSQESSAHDNFKMRVIESREGDTHLTLKQLTPVRLLRNDFFQQVQEAEARGASKDELMQLLGRGRAKRGIFEGDLSEGELEIGQVAAAIRDVRPAAEILKNLWEEYREARQKIASD